jgi:Protein of unknwon function (DUF3310)
MSLAHKAVAYIKAHPTVTASYIAKKYDISSSYAYKLKSVAEGAAEEDSFLPSPVPAPEPEPEHVATALDVQVGGEHYKKMRIQPVEFIHANGIPFIEGNIVKYIVRWREKNGIKDLEKVKHYVDLLIQLESRK